LLWGCATDAKSEPWEFGRATKYMTHTLWLMTQDWILSFFAVWTYDKTVESNPLY
jgi:hypothetical protein